MAVCFEKVMKIRIQEPPNPHFEKGDRIHGAAEAFISGAQKKAPPVPEDLGKFAKEAVAMRVAKARTELEWAFTRDWSPTGWFDRDAWLRVKTDVCADTKAPPTVTILDWKTGRQYDDHRQQRSLYALGGLQLVQIGVLAGGSKDTVLTASHLYTDTGFRAEETFKFSRLPALKREWLARIKEMMSDTVYAATPSARACRYCKFGKSRGGPCGQEKL
jgi:hypothetical protein